MITRLLGGPLDDLVTRKVAEQLAERIAELKLDSLYRHR
jgi:hypothetical protein